MKKKEGRRRTQNEAKRNMDDSIDPTSSKIRNPTRLGAGDPNQQLHTLGIRFRLTRRGTAAAPSVQHDGARSRGVESKGRPLAGRTKKKKNRFFLLLSSLVLNGQNSAGIFCRRPEWGICLLFLSRPGRCHPRQAAAHARLVVAARRYGPSIETAAAGRFLRGGRSRSRARRQYRCASIGTRRPPARPPERPPARPNAHTPSPVPVPTTSQCVSALVAVGRSRRWPSASCAALHGRGRAPRAPSL